MFKYNFMTLGSPSSKESSSNSAPAPSPTPQRRYSWGSFVVDALFIAIVSIVICRANEHMLRNTILPPSSNDAMHFNFLAAYSNAISHASSWWEAVLITVTWPSFYPPGSYLVTYLYCQVFGNSTTTALASLTVFIPATVVAIYYVVRPRCGALAAMMAVLTATAVPQCLLCCPRYPSDQQVAFGVIITLCVLFSCDVGRRRGLTWLFGLVFGYSLLFKSNVAWFVAPALFVLLLANWRDWLYAPLTVLWHLSLFAGAFIVCLRQVPQRLDIQEEMIRYSTFLSPTVQHILWCVLGVAVSWWLLSMVHWKKLRYVPMLTNLSQAIALTFLISMPWILVNLALVSSQREVFFNQMLAYSHLEPLKTCALSVYTNSFGGAFMVLLGLGLLFALTKWADAYDRALALTVVFGYIATACCLGPAARYYFPCYFVSACCLATPLRKSKALACAALVLGLGGLMAGIVVPAYPDYREQCNAILQRYHLSDFPVWRCYNRSTNPNECVFSKVWQICPALTDPQGKPRLAILRKDDGRITPNAKPTEFGFDAIEDIYHAIITWSSWHNSCLIPVYTRDDTQAFLGDRGAYVQFLQTTSSLNPDLAGVLRQFMLSHTPEDCARTQANLMAKSSYLIDISTDQAPGLSATEVGQLMHCPNPVHYQVQMINCVIHLWSRQQTAPKATDMNLNANHFAPHIEWYGMYPL